MGNLNRGANRILVNTCNASIFGVYRTSAGVNVLVHKPTGIAIPGLDTADVNKFNRQINFGCSYAGNKEVMLLDMVAPYPASTSNYSAALNLRRDGRKQGWVDSHRVESRVYGYVVPALAAASGTELASADKLTIIKSIVEQINNDSDRFVNAGMTWVVSQDTYNSAATVIITFQNGTAYTVTTSTTDGLAAAINTTSGLNTYVKAYGPTTNHDAANIRVVIETILPCYVSVTAGTNVTSKEFYVKLEVQEEDFQIIPGAGQTNVMWTKVEHSRWLLSTAGCGDADADAITNITVDGADYTLTPATNTNDTTKALCLAQDMAVALSGAPTDFYIGALSVTNSITVISIGKAITDVKDGGVTGGGLTWNVTAVETDITHRWSRLQTKDMFDLFPNGPENAFQHVDLPVVGADYAMIDLSWDSEHYDNVIMDGIIQKRGHVQFYILKSLLPATYTYSATDKDWWKVNASINTNFMDDAPASPNLHFWDLIALWNGDVSLTSIIDPLGTGIGLGIVEV